MNFKFNEFSTNVHISRDIPPVGRIISSLNISADNILIAADENTAAVADKICGSVKIPRCVLKSGEENKTWASAEKILLAATEAGLGRDALFFGIGGGVILDLCGFAASVYKRGCRLAFAATTLLAMVDAAVGGKTGFDLFGIKNLTGTFYPANDVYMPLDSLRSLPGKEWKNGFAELIKTAVLSGGEFFDELSANKEKLTENIDYELLEQLIEKAVKYKAGIVSGDLRESGKRMLLNLGHTFAHALESAAGLGQISHGEAVAWGMVRSCELGIALGITPPRRAEKIIDIINFFGYECACPYPGADKAENMLNAMKSDKKNKLNKFTFIVPDNESARSVVLETENDLRLLKNILNGGINE